MRKLILGLLLIYSVSYSQFFDFNKFFQFRGWLSGDTSTWVAPVYDTTPPDTFDTAPAFVFVPPNAFTITWTPSDVDSTDIATLRIVWTKVDEGGTRTLNIPWATASADSDTTVGIALNYTYPDTIEPSSFVFTLIDSSSNTVSMDAILDTAVIYSLRGMTVSYALIDNGFDGILDTINGIWARSTYSNPNSAWLDTTATYDKIIWYVLNSYDVGCSNHIDAGFGSRDIWMYTGSYIAYLNAMLTDSTYSMYSGSVGGLPIYCNTETSDKVYSFCYETYTKSHNGYNVVVYSDIWGMDSTTTMTLDTLYAPVVTFDSLGIDSTEWFGIDWSVAVNEYWIAFGDTLMTEVADTANGDSLIYSTTTTDTFHWKQNVPTGGWVYYLLVLKGETGYLASYDSLYLPDMVAPLAGTIEQSFTPISYDSISLGYGNQAGIDSIRVDIYSNGTWVKVLEAGDTSNAYAAIHLGVFEEISWSPGDDSLFARLVIMDTRNSTAVIDTFIAPDTLEIFMKADTARSIMEAAKIYISRDSAGVKHDSAYFLMSDIDTTELSSDSFRVKVVKPSNYYWYGAKIYDSDAPGWSSVGIWYRYPPNTDYTPPDSTDIFAVSGDALGTDTLQAIIKGYNSPAVGDSGFIFYKMGSAATSIADSTGLIKPRFAVVDSSSNDTIGFNIGFQSDNTAFVYFVLRDSLGNMQEFADVNRAYTTVDSSGGYPADVTFYWNCDITADTLPQVGDLEVALSNADDAAGYSGRGLEDDGLESAVGSVSIGIDDVSKTAGTLVMWYKPDTIRGDGNRYLFYGDGYFNCYHYANQDSIRFTYGTDGYAIVDDAVSSTTEFVKITARWDSTTSWCSLQIDSRAAVEDQYLTSPTSDLTVFYFSGGVWQDRLDGIFDEIWISSDKDKILPAY